MGKSLWLLVFHWRILRVPCDLRSDHVQSIEVIDLVQVYNVAFWWSLSELCGGFGNFSSANSIRTSAYSRICTSAIALCSSFLTDCITTSATSTFTWVPSCWRPSSSSSALGTLLRLLSPSLCANSNIVWHELPQQCLKWSLETSLTGQ